jgi:eukaryotic-like serine/threonine-protein kinase
LRYRTAVESLARELVVSLDLRQELEAALGSAFRIERELPGAGMSRVFAAVDTTFGRQVVVKILPPELAAEVSVERFKREIQVAAQLHHPNIVPVLSAGRSDDLLFYVMPLIPGESLRSVIDKGPLSLDDATRYALDVASALGYAHQRNIVHRDIKPENILIEGGRAMVTDFGIARAIERSAGFDTLTSTGVSIGTPTYMSPEQAVGDKGIDGRSDIYSLGCVLYEMLSGDPPFQASSARAMISLHLNERPRTVRTARPDLPPSVDRVLFTALAKSPADRFATAEQFTTALGELAADGGSRAPARRQARVRWQVVLGSVAGVVAVSAIVAAVALRGRGVVAAPFDPAHLAVLSFTVAPGDSVAQTAAAGFTRDLIAALQEVPELSVISPEGVRGLETARPDSIGRALRVGTIVTGSLERRGESLDVNVRLVEPLSAVQRASTRVKLPSSQFVQMRDSVVHTVSLQLRELLGRELRLRDWRSETSSNDAWALRARAQQLLDYEESMRRDPRDLSPQLALFARADSLFEAAAQADKRWADPLVAESLIRVRLADYFEGNRSLAHLDTGLAFAARALSRAPGDPSALAARGQLRFLRVFYGGGGDAAQRILDSARADLVTATAANAHLPDAWLALSSVFRLDGDLPGSVEAARHALAADSYLRSVPTATTKLIYALLYSGKTAEARTLCMNATARYPEDPGINTCELGVLGYAGRGSRDVQRMWQLVLENERSGPWVLTAGVSPIARYWAASVLARSGLSDSARSVITATRQRTDASRSSDDYLVPEAQARLVAGDTTAAIALLRHAIALRRTTPILLESLPEFAPMRNDPRFRAALGKR